MRIEGFLDRKFDPPAPFVKAILDSKSLHLSKLVDLHIDTGASASIDRRSVIVSSIFTHIVLLGEDLRSLLVVKYS